MEAMIRSPITSASVRYRNPFTCSSAFATRSCFGPLISSKLPSMLWVKKQTVLGRQSGPKITNLLARNEFNVDETVNYTGRIVYFVGLADWGRTRVARFTCCSDCSVAVSRERLSLSFLTIDRREPPLAFMVVALAEAGRVLMANIEWCLRIRGS